MLRRLTISAFLLAACILHPLTAFAQGRAVVTGTVTDQRGDPLPGTQVVDPSLQKGTTAQADGTYRLMGLPSGRHVLEFRFVGYQTAVRTVTLEVGETVTLDVTLQERVLETEGVTVTGTARAQSTLKTPQDVDVLDSEALAVQHSAALGTMLEESVPGVSSIKTGSQAGKPVLRGLSGSRIVLLKDGIAQEFFQFGVRHFPPTNASEAERIEVVRGSSSILYGSDALGGAINVLTRATPTAEPGETTFGGQARTAYSANNNERVGALELNGAAGPVGARVGFERRIGDNYHAPNEPTFFETGSGGTFGDPKYTDEVPFTNFGQWSGYGQVGAEGSFGRVQLYGDYWANQQNFLLPDGGPDDDNPSSPPPVGLAQNLEHGNLLLKGHLFAGNYVLKPRLSVQRSIRQSAAPGTVLDDVDADGGVDDFDYPVDLKNDVYTARLEVLHPTYGVFSGTLGAEVQHQDADTRGPAELQPSATTWSAGLFLFEEAAFGPWTITGGLRGDVQTVDAAPNERTTDPDALENTYTTLSGGIGAAYLLREGISLATNLSSGFRAPSVFELYASGVHGGVAAFQMGTPDLDPERSFSADVSLRVRRNRITAEVVGYVNVIRDYIFLENTQTVHEPTGLPLFSADQTDAVIPGLEASVEMGPLPWLRFGGQTSVLGGTGDELGDEEGEDGALPLLPADKLSGFVRWLPAGPGGLQNPSLEVEVKHVFDKDAAGRFEPFSQFDAGFGPPFGTASTKAYTVVNLSARTTLQTGFDAPITLRIGVDNLFDVAYRDFLDTYKGYALSPGRDVSVSLLVSF